MAQGYRYIRLQISVPGMSGYGAGSGGVGAPKVQALHNDPVYEPGPYIRRTVKMLEECRKQLGDEIELLHDIHERISPREAVQFAKDVEPVKLFFLEDALLPGRHRLLPPDPAAVEHAARHGRACSTARTSGHRSSPSG